jgi:peptidoglycan L-alanyl-D-glutamate endopeptidase CwlK
MRTEEQQRLYVARGASMTMDSRHLTGHAVDLVPYIDGQLRWDWPLCIKIAEAMREAAIQEAVSIVWGGVWDTLLSDLNGDLQNAMTDYSLRVRASGRQKTFFDGPHYELHRGTYR